MVVGFFVSMFAGALWLTLLYNSTGGSLLAVAFWHVSWNVMNICGAELSEPFIAILNALMILTGIVALAVGGAARLSVSPKHTHCLGRFRSDRQLRC